MTSFSQGVGDFHSGPHASVRNTITMLLIELSSQPLLLLSLSAQLAWIHLHKYSILWRIEKDMENSHWKWIIIIISLYLQCFFFSTWFWVIFVFFYPLKNELIGLSMYYNRKICVFLCASEKDRRGKKSSNELKIKPVWSYLPNKLWKWYFSLSRSLTICMGFSVPLRGFKNSK